MPFHLYTDNSYLECLKHQEKLFDSNLILASFRLDMNAIDFIGLTRFRINIDFRVFTTLYNNFKHAPFHLNEFRL